MKILFYINSPHGAALEDLEWCETHPVGGSETAALRMASALQKLGMTVRMVTDEERLQPGSCDVFVSLRVTKPFGRPDLPGKLNYLWCHDDTNQPAVQPLADRATAEKVYARCTGVILLSHYHLGRWLEEMHLPPEKAFLSSNGIPVQRFAATPASLRGRPPRAYYSSVPWRGLDPLLQAWPWIRSVVPKAELLVFSSLQVYNREENKETIELYEKAKGLEGVSYRGSVGQAELREAAQTCRVLAYPCIFPETSCITAMEAMAAGCVVVGTALGALTETAWRNPLAPLKGDWIKTWAFETARLLVDEEYYLELARQNLILANSHFDWSLVARRWLLRFKSDAAGLGIKFAAGCDEIASCGHS